MKQLSILCNHKSPIICLIFIFSSIIGLSQTQSYEEIRYKHGWILIKQNGKYGLLNKESNFIIEPKNDSLTFFKNNLAAVSNNGKWGLIDQAGHYVLPEEYDGIGTGFLRVGLDSHQLLFQHRQQTKEMKASGLILVRKKNLIGYVDSTNAIIVPLKYTRASTIRENDEFVAENTSKKQGVVNTDNKTILPFKFDEVLLHFKGFKTRIGNKWGFSNKNHIQILEHDFQEIETRSMGIWHWVKKNELWGVYNSKGEKILNTEFSQIDNASEGFLVSNGPKMGFYNSAGKKILDTQYSDIKSLYGSKKIIAAINGAYGIYNSDGTEIVPPNYDNIEPVKQGNIVSLGSKKGFIDNLGQLLIDIKFDNIETSFLGPGLKVQSDGKFGMYSTSGKLIIEPSFDNIELNIVGAIVTKDSLQGFYKLDGKLLIPISYDDVQVWKSAHTIIVEKNGKRGLFDRNGNITLPIEYDSLDLYPEGYILAKLKGNWGIYSAFGEVLTEPKWEDVRHKSSNLLEFYDGIKWIEFDIKKALDK